MCDNVGTLTACKRCPEPWLHTQALCETKTLACTCSTPAQALRKTNNLLAKYGSERRWLSLLLSANKDKARFETLHKQLEACVRHVTDMVALEQVRGGGGIVAPSPPSHLLSTLLCHVTDMVALKQAGCVGG